jgi:glutaconate CoA-transferase, subunit A
VTRIMTPDDVVSELWSGMTLGIGGWGSRRKPMALVRALAKSDITDLHVVSYGGPDVGILCALGKVAKLTFGFVSLDSIPLEPHFRAARQTGSLREIVELDEGMFQLGLRAAAWGLDFLPTRAGLGSDVLKHAPHIQTITSPYSDQELVAVPALKLDAALVHMNRADARGVGQFLGPDPYFDDWFCMAATKAYVSAESLELDADACLHSRILHRGMVSGVVHAPGGAWFTECPPDYPRDEALQKRYAATAKDPDAWAAFVEEL